MGTYQYSQSNVLGEITHRLAFARLVKNIPIFSLLNSVARLLKLQQELQSLHK